MGHSLPPCGRRSVEKKGWLVLDSTYPQVAENLQNGIATSLNSRGAHLTLKPPCFSPSLWVLHISPSIGGYWDWVFSAKTVSGRLNERWSSK